MAAPENANSNSREGPDDRGRGAYRAPKTSGRMNTEEKKKLKGPVLTGYAKWTEGIEYRRVL